MATTIVNPASNNDSSSNNGLGFLIGAVVLIVFVVLFFVYVFPSIQRGVSTGGANINVPKDINLNVKQTK